METIDKLTDEVQALKNELKSVKIDSNASKTVLHDSIHICTISAKNTRILPSMYENNIDTFNISG